MGAKQTSLAYVFPPPQEQAAAAAACSARECASGPCQLVGNRCLDPKGICEPPKFSLGAKDNFFYFWSTRQN